MASNTYRQRLCGGRTRGFRGTTKITHGGDPVVAPVAYPILKAD